MAIGNTFEFNQEAYDKIIFKESLFGDLSSSQVATEDHQKSWMIYWTGRRVSISMQ